MPLYEYECTVCKRHTEKIQKFSDPEITDCPFCGGKLERVVSAPAISFKGGGWYADGYGNAKPSAPKSETSEGSSTSAPTPASKPAASDSGSAAKDSATSAPAPSTPAPSTSSSSESKH